MNRNHSEANWLASLSSCLCFPVSLCLSFLLSCNLTIQKMCLVTVFSHVCACTMQRVITHTPGAFKLCVFKPSVCCWGESWESQYCYCWPAGCHGLFLSHRINTWGITFKVPLFCLPLYRDSVSEHGCIWPVKGSIFTGFLWVIYRHSRCLVSTVSFYYPLWITPSVSICLCCTNCRTYHPSLYQFLSPLFPPNTCLIPSFTFT